MAERLSLMPFVAAAKKRGGLPIEDLAQEERVLAAARREVANAARASGRSPPPSTAVDAFFRAQMTAAKAVQANASGSEDYTLEDLRPAIARITARQARLVVRIPRGLDTHTVAGEVQQSLEGLDAPMVLSLSTAIVALGR